MQSFNNLTRDVIDREAERAARFVQHAEPAREWALCYGDAKFFAKLAYKSAFLCQLRFINTHRAEAAVLALRQAVRDFATALELGYPTEAAEVNNWFYRALVVNDQSLAHFLASLPRRVWPYGGDLFRFQAALGFAVFRNQLERATEYLDSLAGLCLDAPPPASPEEKAKRVFLEASYHLMEALVKGDAASATKQLHRRAEVRPVFPLEGTRYEPFQLLDLIGLGFCRLAQLRGMTLTVKHALLPLDWLNEPAPAREPGKAKPTGT